MLLSRRRSSHPILYVLPTADGTTALLTTDDSGLTPIARTGEEAHGVYFVASAQTDSPLSNTIRQVWLASSRQIELNRPTTLSFTITGPVLSASSPDASTST